MLLLFAFAARFRWLVLIGCCACAPSFQHQYLQLRTHLKANAPDKASALLERQQQRLYGGKNELLYWLDKAMVEHLAGHFEQSNQALEHAKELAEQLWTESVGAHMEAWLTTDNALPYQGEDFERVFVATLAAINYTLLGNFPAAAVEARQIHALLALYDSTYKEGQSYQEDAFARWLSGMIAEAGDRDDGLGDAWIDYNKALALYSSTYPRLYQVGLPSMVVRAAWYVLARMGPEFAAERRQLLANFPSLEQLPIPSAEQGRIVVLHFVGEAPHKEDRYWVVPVEGQMLRIAYPIFAPGDPVAGYFVLRQEGVASPIQLELLQNMEAIAVRNLADHMQRIQSKAIARAVSKYLLGRGIQAIGQANSTPANSKDCPNCRRQSQANTTGQALAALWQMTQFLLEEADKRSWLLLPQRIEGQVIYTTPGRHALRLVHMLPSGQERLVHRFEIDVAAGATAFAVHRSFP